MLDLILVLILAFLKIRFKWYLAFLVLFNLRPMCKTAIKRDLHIPDQFYEFDVCIADKNHHINDPSLVLVQFLLPFFEVSGKFDQKNINRILCTGRMPDGVNVGLRSRATTFVTMWVFSPSLMSAESLASACLVECFPGNLN